MSHTQNTPRWEGLEHLTQDAEGYVYWKGTRVEHFSFRDRDAEELQAARELAQQCEHLERLGVTIGTGTAVWYSSWYEQLSREQMDSFPPLVRELLRQPRALYESDGRFCWLAEHQAIDGDEWKQTGRFCVFDHGEQSSFHLESDDIGCFYHPLVAAGWNIPQMGQKNGCGCCYATTEQLLNWFASKGLEVLPC